MNRRFLFIKVIAPIIFFIVFVYLSHQLVRLTQTPKVVSLSILIWLLFVIGSSLALPLFFWTRDNHGETEKDILYQKIAYLSQNYFSYILFFVILRDLLGFVFELFNELLFKYDINETYVILILPIFAMSLGRAIVRLGPFIKTIKITSNKVGKRIIHIAQISDLHIGPGMTGSMINRVIERTNNLNADIIVLTGDIIDHLDKWFETEINLLKKLKAKHGVYYVPGNHEYYWGAENIIAKIKSLGIKVLLNENTHIDIDDETVTLCGVSDFAANYFKLDGPDLNKASKNINKNTLNILLAHQPIIADEAASFLFDLQLSGHTHAGQFIPWSLIIRLFQKYPKGLYKIKNMDLYVNRGTGFWGPSDRLGTFSEITSLKIGQFS